MPNRCHKKAAVSLNEMMRLKSILASPSGTSTCSPATERRVNPCFFFIVNNVSSLYLSAKIQGFSKKVLQQFEKSSAAIFKKSRNNSKRALPPCQRANSAPDKNDCRKTPTMQTSDFFPETVLWLPCPSCAQCRWPQSASSLCSC